LTEKILNYENKNKKHETTTDQMHQSIVEKDVEIEKLKKDLITFEKETKNNIETIQKEKDIHISRRQSLDENLSELQIKYEYVNKELIEKIDNNNSKNKEYETKTGELN